MDGRRPPADGSFLRGRRTLLARQAGVTCTESNLPLPNFNPKPRSRMASYTDEDLQNLIERVGVLGGYL
jgi:hypothetical protein